MDPVDSDGDGIGDNLTNLTNWPANYASSDLETVPAWSPHGRKIVFASDRGGNWELYVMDGDGSNQIRLTTAYAASSVSSEKRGAAVNTFTSGGDLAMSAGALSLWFIAAQSSITYVRQQQNHTGTRRRLSDYAGWHTSRLQEFIQGSNL